MGEEEVCCDSFVIEHFLPNLITIELNNIGCFNRREEAERILRYFPQYSDIVKEKMLRIGISNANRDFCLNNRYWLEKNYNLEVEFEKMIETFLEKRRCSIEDAKKFILKETIPVANNKGQACKYCFIRSKCKEFSLNK